MERGALSSSGRSFWKRGLLVLVAVAGGAAWWIYSGSGWARDSREILPPDALSQTDVPQGYMVTAEPVAFRQVQRFVDAVGTLYGYEEIIISTKVEGLVRRLACEVADRVRPGDCLVEIDPVDFELAVEQAQGNLEVELSKLGLTAPPDEKFDPASVPMVMLAQAQIDNAQANYDRFKRLTTSSAMTASDMDGAVAKLRTAQAEHANQLLIVKSGLAMVRLRQAALAVSRQELADTRTLTPALHRTVPGQESGVSFVVTSRAVSDGTFVRKGDEICRLAVDQTLKLRVPVPERHADQIKLGQAVEVRTASSAEVFPGIVTLINPSVDVKTRTFHVEVRVPNSHGRLKPGGFAKAHIHTSRSEDNPTVPLSAVVTFAGVTKVFLVEDNHAKEVQVQLGVQTRDWVEITHPPLPRESLVITSGMAAIADQSAVSIRRPPVPALPATPDETPAPAAEFPGVERKQ